MLQVLRVAAVVFDGICVSHYLNVLQSLYGVQKFQLNVLGKRGGHSLQIIFIGGKTHWLDKKLVTGSVGKAHYLILNRGAISGAYAVYPARIKR